MRRLKKLLVYTVAFSAVAIGIASAADLPAKMYTKAPIADPIYNWTGFYAGLNAGGSWGSQSNSLTTAAGVVGFTNSDQIDGFIGGGQIGYNWQFNQMVVGVEADFQGSGQKGDGSYSFGGGGGFFALVIPTTTIAYTDKLDWFGTVRGRLGWAAGPWLPYVTGGWAYGHGSVSGTQTTAGVATPFSASQSYNGWTLGGGVEWAFAKQWSAKAEYLYINFGNGPTATIGTSTLSNVSGKMTDNIARLGVNYKF